MKPQLGASPIRSGIGTATSQPITSSRFLPTRSARPPAARLVTALAAPKASTKARMAVFERRPKSCWPTSGRTLRSKPTIPPTSAFRRYQEGELGGVLAQAEADRRGHAGVLVVPRRLAATIRSCSGGAGACP